MSLFANMRISKKLLTSTIILSAVFCAAIGVYHLVLLLVTDNYQHLHDHELQIKSKADSIGNYILKTRKAEIGFVADQSETYQFQVSTNVESVIAVADSILELSANDPDYEQVTHQAELIKKRADKAQKSKH